MANLHLYSPSETTHFSGPFSAVGRGYAGSTGTYSVSTQYGPASSIKYTAIDTNLRNLPPVTDSSIGLEAQPSLTARLHRRKKTYQPPTAPPTHASQPQDPLRAARLAWRLQEEYAEQLRIEEEAMQRRSSAFQHHQRESGVRQTAPARSQKRPRRVRSKWQAFMLWLKLGIYRFTRNVKSVFK